MEISLVNTYTNILMYTLAIYLYEYHPKHYKGFES